VKNLQKVIIVLIIAMPVLIGILLLIGREGTAGRSFSAAVPFKRIGLVQIYGEITESSDYVRQLRLLRLDNTIAGVLLRIDSPGGAVAPSQELYAEVARYKAQGKPLIVTMGSVAASGGYYIASAANKIFADPGTITGSIGVIFTVPMIEKLEKKIGLEIRTYKSGEFKDLGNMNRDATEAEKKLIQNLLDDTHEQFISDVARGRKIKTDSVRILADGRIFSGRQAVTVHLVDTLGGYEDALDYLRKITGVSSHSRIVVKRQRVSVLRDFLTEELTRFVPFLSLARSPGMYYLFDPSKLKF
jgi:protease IV